MEGMTASPLPSNSLAPGASPANAAPLAIPDVATLKKMLDDSRSSTASADREAIIDIDYYDGKQWTRAERAALRKRKQPDITINRIKPAINGILGVTQRGKADFRAYPRTPADDDSSDVATDALQYISDFNRFPNLKQDVFKDMLVAGSGACLIGADSDMEITVEQIRWEEFFYDPRSRRVDFKDARYLGIAKWMYVDDAAGLWPDKRQELSDTLSQGALGGIGSDKTQDRPASQVWVDRTYRRLMVVEVYYREAGQWMRCVFYSGGVLECAVSPYVDHKGRPDCPIEAISAYVDRDNNRYSPVRDMRGPQDEVNQRRSKSLHLYSTRQIQEASPGAAIVDADTARAEAARPDGVIPSGWAVVQGNFNEAAGQLQLLQEAKNEIERMGPNPAILGRDGADSSGRALLARQQSGLVELAILFGGIEDWELRCGRQMWARAKQYWKAPMWIRVTDDEGAPRFVGLNQPKGPPVLHPPVAQQPPTMGNGQPNPQAGQPVTDPQTGQPVPHPQAGQPVIDPQTGKPQEQPLPTDPNTGQPQEQPDPLTGKHILGYKNVVAEMDIDIILDTTPDTANIQQEQFQDIMQAIGGNPVWAQQVPLELLLQLSTIPHKKDIIDKLEAYRQQQQQSAAAQQQAQVEQQAAVAAAGIKKTDADANFTTAKTAVLTGGALLEAHQAGMEAATHPPPAQLPQEADAGLNPPPGTSGASAA